MPAGANETEIYAKDSNGITVYINKTAALVEYRLSFGLGEAVFCYITSAPTGNCQWGSVCYANNILNQSNAREIFKKINDHCVGKPMLLLDVNRSYSPYVEKIFTEKDIVVKTPYDSTNSSKMVLYLVKTTSL